MIIPHTQLGQIGVVGDQNGQALPVNAWTDSMNVRFTPLGIEKIAESVLRIRSDYKFEIFTTKIRYDQVYVFAASKNGLHIYDGETWKFTPIERGEKSAWQFTHWGDTVIFNCPDHAPHMLDWDALDGSSGYFTPLPKWGVISTTDNLENGEDPSFDTELRCERLIAYKSQLVAVGVTHKEPKRPPTPERDPIYSAWNDVPSEYEDGVALKSGDQWYVVTEADFDYENPDPSGLEANVWDSASGWVEFKFETELLTKDNVVWVSDTTSDPTYKVPEGAAGGGANAGVTGAVAGGPPSWDYVSPATLSVQQVVGASDGRYIAAELLNESVIIYTATAAHALVFTGGQYVVQTRRLFQRGCAGRQCVVEFSGNHFVIDGDQLYIHDGSQATRVGEDMFDIEFFRKAVNLNTATLCHDPENREIWIYFDTNGGRRSCIYSYSTGTFGWSDGKADGSEITYSSRGYMPTAGALWSDMTSTWAESRAPEPPADSGPAEEGYQWVDQVINTRKPKVLALTRLGIHQKEAVFDAKRECWVERRAIDLDDAGINGWVVKYLKQYHMQVAGEGKLGIRTGWAESALANPTWEKPVWLDEKGDGSYQADMRTSGRYLSLRFEFKEMSEFRWANGYMDIEVSGRR